MKRLMTLTMALLFCIPMVWSFDWTEAPVWPEIRMSPTPMVREADCFRFHLVGTNGVTQVQTRSARPFLPLKIVVADVVPADATVVVQRVRGVVVEEVGTVTAVDGSATCYDVWVPMIYAGDLLRVNGPGLGTATNAIVEVHGVQY